MRLSDLAGYFAAGLVVIAFCMKDMISLRLAALGSNIAFLAYGIALGLAPVWLLHAILLPVNGWRLWQAVWQQPGRNAPRENPRQQRTRQQTTRQTGRQT